VNKFQKYVVVKVSASGVYLARESAGENPREDAFCRLLRSYVDSVEHSNTRHTRKKDDARGRQFLLARVFVYANVKREK